MLVTSRGDPNRPRYSNTVHSPPPWLSLINTYTHAQAQNHKFTAHSTLHTHARMHARTHAHTHTHSRMKDKDMDIKCKNVHEGRECLNLCWPAPSSPTPSLLTPHTITPTYSNALDSLELDIHQWHHSVTRHVVCRQSTSRNSRVRRTYVCCSSTVSIQCGTNHSSNAVLTSSSAHQTGGWWDHNDAIVQRCAHVHWGYVEVT